ncbi:rod shape-determining protein [Pseudidiomarina homiensis]|uniref:Rod shape-determining protein MreB n=1 Tax=Pseudidiomarina homiensis TaxID=364198 RepID=A0A432Y7F8_9GAMM|nr:rod shape-determining protein [Pseudidiomarina homiensis]RUO56821.1 rod shape-determining protein MreB [Pseudidiomarina homiensis]
MIFKALRSLFSFDVVVELSQQRITMRRFDNHEGFEYEPWIAISNENNKEKIKAIGKAAREMTDPNLKIENPFLHTRSFVADFLLAEKVLQYGIFEIHKSKIRPSPRVVMHQLEKTEGGLTGIEDRVLRELALGAGAREVVVHIGAKVNTRTTTFDDLKNA